MPRVLRNGLQAFSVLTTPWVLHRYDDDLESLGTQTISLELDLEELYG